MSLAYAFIGCVELSHRALEHLLGLEGLELVGVVTRRASPFNSDFRSLEDLARRAGCPVWLAEGRSQAELAAFLRRVRPEVVFCLGWSHLLDREVLAVPPRGVIGYHPAALPANRGRHPLIWALALGLPRTASTFFLMDEGADSGDIVSQVPVEITPEDDAASLYRKVSRTALDQLTEIARRLREGTLEARPQDHRRANTWRRRTPADGRIDWRMSVRAIYNLVRALTRPYPGAHCLWQGREAKVWRCRVGPPAPHNLEPGKVLAVEADGSIVVKCYDGSVVLCEHELEPLPEVGSYL